MKKTLFLTAILTLSTSAWGTDCLMPQTIINVSEGATVTQNATNATENVTISVMDGLDGMLSASELMTQAAQKVDGNRPAVVKDGQGTLVIEENVGTKENPLRTTLVVREGTMKIDGATVTTLGSSNGNNLVIGGCNATLELTNGAKYVYTDETKSSSSVSIGGIDGDGKLILTGGSTLATRQQVQTGSASTLPIPTAEDPYWDVGPHVGGTYTKVQGSADNSYYRVSSGAAGYSNQTVTPGGSQAGTAVIQVENGSTLDVGTGFYVGNTTLTIDNATVLMATKAATEDSFIGSKDVFGPTSKSVVTIQNGGTWDTQRGRHIWISYYEGQRSEVTITGTNSLMHAKGACVLGGNGASQADVKILDGGQLCSDLGAYTQGSVDSLHSVLIDGADSVLSAPEVGLEGATTVWVQNGGMIKSGELSATRSDVSLNVTSNGRILLSGPLSLSDGATLNIDGAGSSVSSTFLSVGKNASLVNNNGTIEGVDGQNGGIEVLSGASLENNGIINAETTVQKNGSLKGSGTLGTTNINKGAYLTVGNSPGKQTYTGDLTIAGTVEFSVDDLLSLKPSDSEHSGWGSGTYSVIDMGGNNLVLQETEITITLSRKAYDQLDGVENFEIVFVKDIGNAAQLAAETDLVTLGTYPNLFIQYRDEYEFYGSVISYNDFVPTDSKIYDAHFEIRGNDLVWVYGAKTPEPATATLSLLALAAIASRRKRK